MDVTLSVADRAEVRDRFQDSGIQEVSLGSTCEYHSLHAGDFHTCGVRIDGAVSCWGYDGDQATVSPSGAFASVSAGSSHTCGVQADDGAVIGWGYGGGGARPPAEPEPPGSGPFDREVISVVN